MPHILVTPAAEDDLVNLWVHIARDIPDAADRVYQVVEQTFDQLSFMPRMGTLYRSRRARLKGLRFIPVIKFPHYIIYYRELPDGIEIIRILHGRMERQRRLDNLKN